MPEKRKQPRVTFRGMVFAEQVETPPASANATMGKTIDISEGGILLEADSHFPFLSIIKLGLVLGSEMVDIKGQVVRLQKQRDGSIRMGIHFADMTPQDRNTLRNYCLERLLEYESLDDDRAP
ncbi:MAG: PilZ domain-containing protein [Planctomycetes bacterium]|nr:PilZ domain-containing protein [Planctomycetota bacterium]